MWDKYILLLTIIAIVLALPQAIVAILKLIKEYESRRKEVKIARSHPDKYGDSNIRLLTLRQQESGGSGWIIVEILADLSALLLLLFDGYTIYWMVSREIPLPVDLASVCLLVFIIGLPLFILTTSVVTLIHYWRTGMSWINFQGEIVLEGETAVIFDKCKEVVKAMEAKTTHVEQRPNFIIAELDRDRIIVRLKRVRGTKHKLNILSQCKSPTVMVDGGRNRKNVNTFLNDIMPTPTTDH